MVMFQTVFLMKTSDNVYVISLNNDDLPVSENTTARGRGTTNTTACLFMFENDE